MSQHEMKVTALNMQARAYSSKLRLAKAIEKAAPRLQRPQRDGTVYTRWAV